MTISRRMFPLQDDGRWRFVRATLVAEAARARKALARVQSGLQQTLEVCGLLLARCWRTLPHCCVLHGSAHVPSSANDAYVYPVHHTCILIGGTDAGIGACNRFGMLLWRCQAERGGCVWLGIVLDCIGLDMAAIALKVGDV